MQAMRIFPIEPVSPRRTFLHSIRLQQKFRLVYYLLYRIIHKAKSLMVFFTPNNLVRPINLLQQHHPHKLVGKRHTRKRELQIRSPHHLSTQSERPTNHKRHFAAPVRAELIQLRRQLLG
jgi:hypothetical protein